MVGRAHLSITAKHIQSCSEARTPRVGNCHVFLLVLKITSFAHPSFPCLTAAAVLKVKKEENGSVPTATIHHPYDVKHFGMLLVLTG